MNMKRKKKRKICFTLDVLSNISPFFFFSFLLLSRQVDRMDDHDDDYGGKAGDGRRGRTEQGQHIHIHVQKTNDLK